MGQTDVDTPGCLYSREMAGCPGLPMPPLSRASPLQQRPPCELVALSERACSNYTAECSSWPWSHSLCCLEGTLNPLLQPRAIPTEPPGLGAHLYSDRSLESSPSLLSPCLDFSIFIMG